MNGPKTYDPPLLPSLITTCCANLYSRLGQLVTDSSLDPGHNQPQLLGGRDHGHHDLRLGVESGLFRPRYTHSSTCRTNTSKAGERK